MESLPVNGDQDVSYDDKDVYELHFSDGTSVSMISIDDTHFSMDFLLEEKTPNLIPSITNAWTLPCRKDDVFICAFMKAATLFHNWFDYTTAWEEALSSTYKDTPVLQLYYEDLQRDGFTSIRQIADFLELKHSEDFLHKVHTCCGFDNMKNNKIALAGVKNDRTQAAMYRKGKIGDWKNWFKVTESEDFDKVYHSRMKDSKFSYTWE
ncbi:sulfotransferase 1C1-like isoform X1 [Pecten maximus]|uniref:sulfotransferase 1C1-like isoform X1 n=1 Tax=Pecten maximus TaxID=6579 RepID=UPI00145839DE|nr:sulfotransferase 1C1-like isoform X1 [Pecten maximus]